MNCPKCGGTEFNVRNLETVDEERTCKKCGYCWNPATGLQVTISEADSRFITITMLLGGIFVAILAVILAVLVFSPSRPIAKVIVSDQSGDCYELAVRTGHGLDGLGGGYSPIQSMVKVPCPEKKQ